MDMDAEDTEDTEDAEDADMISISETTDRILPSVTPSIQVPVAEEVPVIYRGIHLLTSEYNQCLYGIPPLTCFHARTMWLQAGLPVRAVARFLEIKLMEWAYVYAQMDIQGEEIRSIRYQASTDCLYFCSWRVFLRWMMCACLGSVGC